MDDRRILFESYRSQIDKLLRVGQDINFEEIRAEIEGLLWFYEFFYSDAKYQQTFTEDEKQQINNVYYTKTVDTFQSIISKGDWRTASDATFQVISQWKQDIKNVYNVFISNSYYVKLQAAVAVDTDKLEARKSDLEKKQEVIINDLEQRSKIFLKDQESFIEELTRNRVESTKILDSLKKSQQKAEKSLVKQIESSYGSEFWRRADDHNKAARNWLIAQVIFGVIFVLGAAALIIWSVLNPELIKQNPLIAALKFGSLFIGVYVLQILNRNYAANKHLYVMNRHRASVLAITNDMVKAVDGEANKEYLLTYAARMIFDYGESGYITKNYGAGSQNDDTSSIDRVLGSLQK